MKEIDALDSLNTWLISGVPDVGKCYVARLDGDCSKFGFEREFVTTQSLFDDSKWYVQGEAVSKGDVFELCFNGQKSYVRVEAVRSVGVGSKATKQVFDVEISKSDALKSVST